MKRNAFDRLFVAGALVLASAGGAAAQQQSPYKAHPSTQEPNRVVTLEQLAKWETELSNWGRWGPTDQRGTLNLITPAKMKQAAALIKEGEVATLQHLPFRKSGMDTGAFGENYTRMVRIDPKTGAAMGAIDWIGLSLHDGLNSHLDALCHYRKSDGKIFNGYPQNLTAAGCQDLAADKMGPAVITRGVLVDMALMKGVKWLEPSTPIYVEDLEAWEKFANVKIGPGDALLIRGGRWAKRAADGPWLYGAGGAGLHASTIPWLRARDVSILISDAVNDVQPSGVQRVEGAPNQAYAGRPVHTLTQVTLGLPIVDNAYLEDVAEVAARLKRWEFFFNLHIMQIPGGTAAPFNAHAVF